MGGYMHEGWVYRFMDQSGTARTATARQAFLLLFLLLKASK